MTTSNSLDHKYFQEILEAMFSRPLMYAQGPGSFEDQVLLLMIFMADSAGMSTEVVGKDYGDYRKKVMASSPSNMTLATEFNFKSPTPINRLLKTFYEEFCSSHGFKLVFDGVPSVPTYGHSRPQT